MSRRAHLAVVVVLAILALSINVVELVAGERLSWWLLVAAVVSVSVYGTTCAATAVNRHRPRRRPESGLPGTLTP